MFENTKNMIERYLEALEKASVDTSLKEEREIVLNREIDLAKALIQDLGDSANVVADIINVAHEKEHKEPQCFYPYCNVPCKN